MATPAHGVRASPRSAAPTWQRGVGIGNRIGGYHVSACLVASSGGLIFGYDIGISIMRSHVMDPFLIRFFPSVYAKEQEVVDTNQYCKFDSVLLTLFTSSLYLAALVASLFASVITRKLGRRATISAAASYSSSAPSSTASP